MMARKTKNMGAGAFVKKHTTGISNELSFSVLDAKSNKAAQGASSSKKRGMKIHRSKAKVDAAHSMPLGKITLFTLPSRRRKDINATPERDKGLPLQSGEFVFSPTAPLETSVPGQVSLESSDILTPKDNAARTTTAIVAPARVKEPPNPEKKAKHRKVAITSIAAAFLICVFVAAGVYAYTEYNLVDQEHRTQITRLRSALSLVAQVDNSLVAMDRILTREIDMASFNDMAIIEEQTEDMQLKLDEAAAIALSVEETAIEQDDRDAAVKVGETIDDRKTMLGYGKELVSQSKTAVQTIELLEDAWDQIYIADESAREAARLATGDNIDLTKMISETDQASTEMHAAHEKLMAVANLVPQADLSDQIGYVVQRMEALQHATASNTALLAGDTQTAQAENDAYNEAEAKSAKTAAELSVDRSQPIVDAYNEQTADLAKNYVSTRAHAAQADLILRNYLTL